MAVHYCPKCGEFSHHPTTAPTWALKCPSCGTTAAQHPHPPEPKRKAVKKRPAAKKTAAKKTATAPRPDPAGTDADA